MSDARFTPGPWGVVQSFTPCIKTVKGPSFNVQAVMWATDLDESDYWKRQADLHLIAAAPELYEALEDALHFMESVGPPRYVRMQCESALAKARGQS